MRLTLVIPCYNEAANLPRLVERCVELTADPRVSVILVDNGSTDDTPAVLASLLAGRERLCSLRVEPNAGYGAGILAGLRAADGDVIGWTHADLQTDPLDAARAFAAFEQAGGTRLFVKGRRSGRPLLDVVLTAGMTVLETLLMRTPLSDINAQPTLLGRELFDAWRDPPGDFSLDLYAFCQAARLGWPVRRIPVHFGKRQFGQSHWNTGFTARVKFIRRTLRYSFALRRRMRREDQAAA